MTTYTNYAPVEAAIQDSLRSAKPALLLTEDGETFSYITGVLAGVCDAQGPEAPDGTLRFYGSHDDGRTWDVRLRLETGRARAGATPHQLEQRMRRAEMELVQAVHAYKCDPSTDHNAAVRIAITNADQARSDAVDSTLETSAPHDENCQTNSWGGARMLCDCTRRGVRGV